MATNGTPVTFHDSLAEELWRARLERRSVHPRYRPEAGFGVERAEAIAGELYGAIRSLGAQQVAWKLGATDAAAQAKLGASAPFSAPVFDQTVIRPAASIIRSELVAPIVEAEVGVSFRDGVAHALPCVEIADSRFANWPTSVAEAIADFGLQGLMMFGAPVPTPAGSAIEVAISCDGVVVRTASRSLDVAVAAAEDVRRRGGHDVTPSPPAVIATGSIAAPVPLSAGSWRVDFGTLGRLDFTVRD